LVCRWWFECDWMVKLQMTADAFRKLALALPETIEAAHMNHPDFRVKGHIFASLASKGPEWGMVKISMERQSDLVESFPGAFEPASGAWGRAGYTMVNLPEAKADIVKGAMEEAWALLCNKPAAKKRVKKQARRF
jgi:hypothetical protein